MMDTSSEECFLCFEGKEKMFQVNSFNVALLSGQEWLTDDLVACLFALLEKEIQRVSFLFLFSLF